MLVCEIFAVSTAKMMVLKFLLLGFGRVWGKSIQHFHTVKRLH